MVNSAINQSILPLVDQSLKNKLGCFSFVLCFLATVSVNVIGSQQERHEAKVPNIIIIYADDLGINKPDNGMRISFGNASIEDIQQGIERLGLALKAACHDHPA